MQNKHFSHPEFLLLGQQVVLLVALVQSHQNVLQPVPHTQGELAQLAVQAGLDVCGKGWIRVTETNLSTVASFSALEKVFHTKTRGFRNETVVKYFNRSL